MAMPPPPTIVIGWSNRLSAAGLPHECARAGSFGEVPQAGQQQRERVLGYWLSVGTLCRSPLPPTVKHAGFGHYLDTRRRQLNPRDLRMSPEYVPKFPDCSGVGPDQADGLLA
jgi:hypothetical protein